MQELVTALTQVGSSLWTLVVVVGRPVLPWAPLLAWVVFWLFAVNWIKLRGVLAAGGWIGAVLLGVLAVLIWGTVAPYEGKQPLFGLEVTNFVEKTVYVTILACIALLSGSVQMSGNLGGCCMPEETVEDDVHAHHDSHGHDSHGHDDHGHEGHGHEAPHQTIVQPALH